MRDYGGWRPGALWPSALLGGLCFVVAACSSPSSPSAVRVESPASDPATVTTAPSPTQTPAQKICQNAATNAPVAGADAVDAEGATAKQVVAWQEGRAAQEGGVLKSRFRLLDPTTQLTVCVFEGSGIVTPGPPPLNGDGSLASVTRGPQELTLIVDGSGQVTLDSSGPVSAMGPLPAEYVPPSAAPATTPTTEPEWTGSVTTLATGVQGAGPGPKAGAWELVARPTSSGFCYGIDYGTPAPDTCFNTATLQSTNQPILSLISPDPSVLLGVTPADVTSVVVTLSTGDSVTIKPTPMPAGFPADSYFARPVAIGATVLQQAAYDANGNKMP